MEDFSWLIFNNQQPCAVDGGPCLLACAQQLRLCLLVMECRETIVLFANAFLLLLPPPSLLTRLSFSPSFLFLFLMLGCVVPPNRLAKVKYPHHHCQDLQQAP